LKFSLLLLCCVTAFGQTTSSQFSPNLIAPSQAASGHVTFDRIVHADKEPGNWLTYSRDYQGRRYSPLKEVTTRNVANLKVKWAYQFGDPANEVSPIVVDGVVYLTGRSGPGNDPCPLITAALASASPTAVPPFSTTSSM
jgi:glucose dehydrogenase